MESKMTRRGKLNRVLMAISASLVAVVSLVLAIVSLTRSDAPDSEFDPTITVYSSDQAHIVNTNTSASTNTITMTDAYNGETIGNKVITISNATELYYFSLACKNSPSTYLSKEYKLISNINYNIQSQFIPVGYNGTPFSGIFDGCGFEISNLKMVDITSQIGNEDQFAKMTYYAMFSENEGTIKNLGIVESRNTVVSVELDKVINNGGAANLVGKNHSTGTVEFCYYRDLRNMIEDEIGLAFYGAYRLAGLVYQNDGTFENCYLAVSTVANHKITGYESISGICYLNNNYSSSSNLYFYDGSIDTYSSNNGTIEITFVDDVFFDETFLDAKQNAGVYCSSLATLNSNYTSNARWYLPSKYDNTLKVYIKNETPILRGLSFTLSEGKYIFNVNNVNDFLYMFELMNQSDFFAGNQAIYQINSDINLINIEPSHYIYKKIMNATITSNKTGSSVAPTLITGESSSYPTIYNFDCVAEERKTPIMGIDAYGLIPYLGGTISYLNIVPSKISLDSIEATNNVKGIAAVSGYVEKGYVSHVNVYVQTEHKTTDIKEFYLGGVIGILGGEGSIDNCTSAGSYSMNRFSLAQPIASVYTQGDAIGGVVGYICETYGSINDCLSAVNMTLNMNAANVDFQIGGVVGAAYTIEANGLENVGTIDVGTSSASANYKSLYLSGVVGRHLGVKGQVYNFTNQGNVTLYGQNTTAKKTYLSGIENADILTSALSTGLIASTDKTKDGRYRFRASSFANRANVVLGNDTIADAAEYTSGINVISGNGFVSELAGIYNLNYSEKYASATTKTIATLDAQTFDLYKAHKYSGVVNVVNDNTSSATTSLQTVYNLRDFTINSSTSIAGAYTYEYYGAVRGKYINYDDVRNEGKITTTLTNSIGSSSNSVNIILVGVMQEVSEGCSADNIFNGGDISLTFSNSIIYGDVIASGICYRNKGYDASTIDTFNPSLNEFDSKAKGSLNNAINNGSITIDNPTNFASIQYDYGRILSGNGVSYLGSFPFSKFGTVYNITGDIFAAGVTAYNEAPITNTFNLGDILAVNYINSTSSEKEINAAGLAGLNIGKYAYILNSANNGDIKAYNLSTGNTTKNGENFDTCTPFLSNVNAAGIVARNDELESGSEYTSNTSNPHSSQIISFTINYGDIYSYNYRPNIQTTAYEPTAKSAGIVAMGLLKTVNVMNYGNIYGSETASGIFGVMYFSKFQTEVSQTNKINIANTINYGNVYMLSKGYNHVHGDTYLDYAYLSYSRLKTVTSQPIVTTHTTKGNIEAFTEVARNSNYLSKIGSIFSLANYATSNNAQYITIRYLISFNDKCPIVGETVLAPNGVNVDTNTLFSAHISTNAATGAYLNDKWINNYVQYAPLSTSSVSGNFVTNIDPATGDVSIASRTYYGIFNTNFEFSKAILGKTTLDLTTNPTDQYLTDYFQFVGFKYINPVLFEKIGWQAFAYKAAGDDFATNVSNVIKLLGKSTNYTNYQSNSKNAFAWMQNSISKDLDVLIDTLVEEEDYASLLSVLEYIYSEDSQSNIYIDTQLRRDVLAKLIDDEDDLLDLLNVVLKYESGFSSTLAKSIVVNEDAVKDFIESYIDTMSASDMTSMLSSYITYLEATNNDYFVYSTSEMKRIELLTTLFENINDSTFYKELVSILGINDQSLTDPAKMLYGYQHTSLQTAAAKKALFETIINYNYTQDKLDEYIDDMSSEIDYFTELNNNGYNVSSISDIYTKADLNSGSTSDSTSIVDERVKLWNLIKNTNVFINNYSTFNIPSTLYFNATEYNNTYQSVTEPHNTGAYVGDTNENRLSYLYTTDITPAVYFYGPYTETDSTHTTSYYDFSRLVKLNDKEKKRGLNRLSYQNKDNKGLITNNEFLGTDETYHAIFHSTDSSLWSSNEKMLSRGGNNSQITYASALNPTQNYTIDGNGNYSYNVNCIVPMLIYYDFNNEQLGGANDTFTLSSNFYVSGSYAQGTSYRGFNGSQFNTGSNLTFMDPVIGQKYKCTDWVGTLFGSNDLYMYVSATGERFSLNNASVGPAFLSNSNDTFVTTSNGNQVQIAQYRCYIKDADGVNHLVQAEGNQTIQIGRMVNGTFTPIHTLKNYSNKDYTRAVYSFLTYELGIRMWSSTVNTTYHSTGRTGIYRHSGQWDNYFTWKQSNGTRVFTSQIIDYAHSDLFNLDGVLTEYDAKTKSDDERYIINYLFTTYFLTSSKYATFRKLVQAALLESLGDNDTRGADYINNFFITNIYSPSRDALGKVPFAYLYYASGTTVQQYLNGLQSIGANNNKQLLIYGTSGNQTKYVGLLKRLKDSSEITPNNNYANLAALLDYLTTHSGYIDSNDNIVLSNFSSLSTSELSSYLSSLDTTDDVTISSLYDLTNKMSSYTGTVTKSQDTYNSTTYEYGFKFTSMTLTPASTDTRIVMIAKSTGTSSTLTKGTDAKTVTTIGEYYFETNGATSVIITSNDDVIVYAINFIQDTTNSNVQTTLTGNFVTDNITYDANNNPLHTSYFTITKNQIENHINSTIVSNIGNNAYYKLLSYSVVANVSVTSTASQIQMNFAGSKNNATLYPNSEFTCYANTTSTGYLTMLDEYYGATIYAVQGNPGSSSYWRYISGVSFTITYNYLTDNSAVGTTSKNATNSTTTNSYSVTLPTLAEVQSFVVSDSGYSSWNSNLTINSVTLSTVTITNGSTAYYLGIYNYTDNGWISNVGYVAANTSKSVSVNLDLTQYYGKVITIVYSTNNNNWYYSNENIDVIISEYSYTANYSYPNNTISPSTIYKNRLLNLNLKYSETQNKYFSYVTKNSTNYNSKYDAFVKANLVNFAALNTSGNDNNPTNLFVNALSDAQKKQFARLIIENSNEALYYAIANKCQTKDSLGDVLKVMDKATNGYAFIADGVVKLNSLNKIDGYSNVVKALIACYIVADYRNTINQGGSAKNTYYYNIVSNADTNATGTSTSGTAFKNHINYINNDGSFDATKYDLFVEYVLGEVTATTSYGIFALASSRGIKNGAFIPDNVSLKSMDVCYDKTATLNNVSYIKLTTTKNPSWRDNLGTSTDEIYITTDQTSVNFHVRVEMKQLVKAISNIIFELDLECDDTTLYSSEDQIDYEDKIITYYVSEKYLNYINTASNLEIVNLIYADTAQSNKAVGSNISLTNLIRSYKEVTITSLPANNDKYYINNAGVYELATTYDAGTKYYELSQIDVKNAITIIPEETAYTANYTIRFIKIDNTVTSFAYYSMYYQTTESSGEFTTTTNSRTIPYYGAKVTFKVVASELPDGMDLKSFFTITNERKGEVWSFDPDTENNGIVSNGEGYIVVNIDINMSQGSKAFVFNLYGNSTTVNIVKDANRNSLITAFGYDGTDYTSQMQSSSHAATSTILFGRAFNYDDLTKPYVKSITFDDNKTYYTRSGENDYYSYSKVLDPVAADIANYYEANEDFYLYSFAISSNATVNISATKSVDATTNLMTYVVTYNVKSEYGSTTEYTHTLTEHLYFDNNTEYGILYKDGVAVDDSGIYKTNFNYGTEEIKAQNYSSLTYDSSTTAENFVAVIFNRGFQPQYRIRYNLSYFYGDISKYTVTQGEHNASVSSPQNTYAGITITVDDDQEPGVYKFNYVYTNTGEWTSEGNWIRATVYDPSIDYYVDMGDGEYLTFYEVFEEQITQELFEEYQEDLVYYQSSSGSSYTRTYSFPALYIVKDYATDALFHKLTFLDESVVLGGTASVMLPTTPISAGDNNHDNDAVKYNTVFANPSANQIQLNPNSIEYSDSAKATTVSDYYTVGTVSDTDLEYYAPTIKVEDHAQVFKYTTLTKLTSYGADNEQTLKDSEILTVRNDMLLYVPFVTGTGENKNYEVFLVLLENGTLNWKMVLPKNFNGVDANTKAIKTYTTAFNTVEAEKTPSLTEFTYEGATYTIAEFAGSTDITSSDSKNLSLYMDYIGDPLEDHFWFISYVVFSEYYLNKGITDTDNNGVDDLGAVRYYHISIVDASNTVYFEVSLYAPEDIGLDEVYLTFAENVYDSTNNFTGSTQLSCYLEKSYDENNNLIKGANGTDVAGLVLYKLKLSMAALPAGYFSFYVDLPNGYGGICYTNKENENNESTAPGLSNKGAYLPHTTIIPITVGLKIIISQLSEGASNVWAVNTSDLYTRKITYSGLRDFD